MTSRWVPRRAARRPAVAGVLLAACLLTGCSLPASSASSGSPRPAAPQAGPAASPSPCPAAPARFSCVMRRRIARVERYLRHRPGIVGVVLHDRSTGATWRNAYASRRIYMASTSKLAMAVTLLLQNRAGAIHLSSADWASLRKMLHVSSDSAADRLWFEYGAPFYTGYFPRIGLKRVLYLPQAGVNGPYWGEMKCPVADLSRVVNYLLHRLPAKLKHYLVYQLRHVGAVQHFGVWGAGRASHPGNKDGWSIEKPGWIINSAGFAGRGERYTLAMMNSLNGQGGYRAGTNTVTQIAALLFQGHLIPAPHVHATS